MGYMEFLKDNFLETASAIQVDSNTELVDYLYDRNYKINYESSGYDSDTSTIISVEFSTPVVVSHLLLMNNNFKQFRVFYDSTTANTFSPDINTTTNDVTNLYYAFSSKTVNSVSIQIDTCFNQNEEKSIGDLILTERRLVFDQNPDARKYVPVIDREYVEHKMPDGGVVQYNIKDKFNAKLGFTYITSTFYNNLLDIYEEGREMYFVPFPTTTSWDGRAYPIIWTGKFDFSFVANNQSTGYKGNILLKERTSGG